MATTTYKFKADGTGYTRGLNKMRVETRQFSASVKGLLAGAFGAAAIRELANEMVEVGRAAKRLGVGVESFQKLAYAAKQAGVDTERMADAMKDLDVKLQDGIINGGSFAELVQEMGLDMDKLSRMNTDERFLAFADAIKEAGGSLSRFGADEFGDAMFELLPLLELGSKRIKELADGFEGFTATDIKAVTEASKDLDSIWLKIKVTLSSALVTFGALGSSVFAFLKSSANDMLDTFLHLGKGIAASLTFDFDEAEKQFAEMSSSFTNAGTRAGKAATDAFDDAFAFVTDADVDVGDPGGARKAAEALTKLKETEEKLNEKRKKFANERMSDEEKLNKLKARISELDKLINRDAEGNVVLSTKNLELANEYTDAKQAAWKLQKKANEDELKSARELASIYTEIAELRGTGGAEDVKALEDSIMKRLKLEDELQRKKKQGGFSVEEEKSVVKGKLSEQEGKLGQATIDITLNIGNPEALEEAQQRADDARAQIKKWQKELSDLIIRGVSTGEFTLDKQIEEAAGDVDEALKIISDTEYKINAGLEVDQESFIKYTKASNELAALEATLAALKKKEADESKKYFSEIAKIQEEIADAKKAEAEASAALSEPENQTALERMVAAGAEMLKLENKLAELRKQALEDGVLTEAEMKAIAEQRLEIEGQISSAKSERIKIESSIKTTQESGEEAGRSESEKLDRAIEKQESLESELAALEKQADADGVRSELEKLEIARKRLEIVEGIADAQKISADARSEIETLREKREERGMSPEELLAKREKQTEAAKLKLKGEKREANEDGKITETEQAAIDTAALDLEKAMDAEDAARGKIKQTEGGVISSSMASIGGGGGVSAFGDPILSENKKQTTVLEGIRTAIENNKQGSSRVFETPEL